MKPQKKSAAQREVDGLAIRLASNHQKLSSDPLQILDDAEKEATEARARLADLRNEYAPKLKEAETAVSLAQSKLSAVIAIVRAASGKA